jgi:hypothetical protein
VLGATDSTRWFKPGDRIVINPGGANQEFATVTALGSLIVESPTKQAHEAGETIVLVGSGDGSIPLVVPAVGLLILLAGVAGALVLARRRART